VALEVDSLVKRFGTTIAADQVSFTLDDGLFLALLGPSGSGKTTVLRMLAGLETPDSGHISIHGRMVFENGRSVPPEERDIGMVFQDYALWPHMTVAENIGFGLRLHRASRREIAAKTTQALELVHLEGLGQRYPDQLSGGQQQRVAIARALAIRPRLLLLDEPLSNLDAALREEMRVELVRLLKDQGITAVYVTHDRIEALAMADRIVVLREGRIVQMGTPEHLYHRPANPFIAGFLGAANFMAGEVLEETAGHVLLRAGEITLHGVAHGPVGRRGVLVLRPEDGTLHGEEPYEETNALQGTVVHSEFLGSRWRHVISIGQGRTLQLLTATRAPRAEVWVRFPLERCLVLGEDDVVHATPA
jgi:iron(III) transport system ATP-binding protein